MCQKQNWLINLLNNYKSIRYQRMLFHYLVTMRKYYIPVLLFILAITACSKKETNTKLLGNWKAKNHETTLKVTDKKFIMDGDEQSAEDYFTKGDTIFTSFEGNQPYTKFVIKKLDEQNLSLVYPDSVMVEFSR
jgi:hypothetical protein